MAVPRDHGRVSAGDPTDTPAFRRRHRLLCLLLALHPPALAALAHLTGTAPREVLVEGAVLLTVVAAGGLLDLAPRLRALTVTAGLLFGSVVVGMLTGSVVGGALHAAMVGLLAAAHVGASWRGIGLVAASAVPESGDQAPAGTGAVTDGPTSDPTATPDDLVEVQEVYTGVWSAQHLVRPRTRLVRLPVTPDAGAQPAATEQPDGAAVGVEGSTAPTSVSRDPDLTREVLEALHRGAVDEPTDGADANATTGTVATSAIGDDQARVTSGAAGG